MKQIPIFDLYRQYLSLKPKIDKAIKDTIKNSDFINGQANHKFETAFAKYLSVKHVIGVSSGSSALTLVLRALNIGKGDEVICPSHTFAATAEAIIHCQAKPVFVDIDEQTYNLDPKLIENAITKHTKAILPVHLYGQPADMKSINKIAKKYQLAVIEDAAQAHGATINNQKVGSLGTAACFSFFPAKNLGCFGDGGAVSTQNDDLAKKIRLLKDHGRTSKYHHEIIGYGERLDNLQAAILLVKLSKLDQWNKKRNQIAKIYNKEINDQYLKPNIIQGSVSSFYVYTLRHPQRDKVIKDLANKGINTGIYYPEPLHLQPAFQPFISRRRHLPITEKVAQEIFSIPLFPELNKSEIALIIKTLNKA